MIVPAFKWLEDHPSVDVGIVAVIIGGLVGFWINKPPAPKPEPYAAAVKQKDGSLVLERTPLTEKDLPPAPVLPKGTHRSRVVGVTVHPTSGPVAPPAGSPAGTKPTCPDVHVDLTFAKAKDGSTRVVAKSPDGEVIGGKDIPVDLVAQPREWRYAAGATYDPLNRNYGLFLHRDFGRIRIGAEVFQQHRLGGGSAVAGQVILGARW